MSFSSKFGKFRNPRLALITASMSALLVLLCGCGADQAQSVHPATAADVNFPNGIQTASDSGTLANVDRISGNYGGVLERQLIGGAWVQGQYRINLSRVNVTLPSGEVAPMVKLIFDLLPSAGVTAKHWESYMATQVMTFGSVPALVFTSNVKTVRELADHEFFLQLLFTTNGTATIPAQNRVRAYDCAFANGGYCQSSTLEPDVRFLANPSTGAYLTRQ
ncbi:MAG: hypothetical protein H7222_01020 [Methylotenera sp.]|nr:hypothetical protein [Oligoflexia bacterium]